MKCFEKKKFLKMSSYIIWSTFSGILYKVSILRRQKIKNITYQAIILYCCIKFHYHKQHSKLLLFMLFI